MVVALAALAIAGANTVLALWMIWVWPGLVIPYTLMAIGQLIAGIVAIVFGVRAMRQRERGSLAAVILGALASVGAVGGWIVGVLLTVLANMGGGMSGGAWGRPLRIRGRQRHPQLREGSDWTRGARPNAEGLDPDTRAALDALWLHDAQKEHASVPAFSRISWMLAAVGAPAELLEWSHRAALEEIRAHPAVLRARGWLRRALAQRRGDARAAAGHGLRP